MSRPQRRSCLAALTRRRLLEIARTHDVEAGRRERKRDLIEALVRTRRVSLEDILAPLSRDELEAICRAHQLEDTGRKKADIRVRVLEAARAGRDRRGRADRPGGGGRGAGGVLGFEGELFRVADQLWTNSSLQPAEYATPVLGLIFLKYAGRGLADRRTGDRARNVLHVPEEAGFDRLVGLPTGRDLGRAVNRAMSAIEAANPHLRGVLPRTYARFERTTLARLLETFAAIPADASGDVFGRIYEYFLGKFAPRTLQKGGEYFTPESVVKLIVEIVEPYHGRIFDPACGSGGMFIQSAHFVNAHRDGPGRDIGIYGVEKRVQTVRLAEMGLAVHGLSGDIREGNSYYDDPHDCVGKFDFVMANPPFNQSAVDKRRIRGDRRRFPFGMPRSDSGNYLWIQLFYAALNENGRAGFVMSNSAGEARGSEAEIRRRLIETGAVDVILALDSNFFYTVSLAVTLWFLDRRKQGGRRERTVLFIDARNIYRQLDRSHRDLGPDQIEFLANIVRLYRGEEARNECGGLPRTREIFPTGRYRDVAGLCAVAERRSIAENAWSLNPGRYVGVAEPGSAEVDFPRELRRLSSELAVLDSQARQLESAVAATIDRLLGGSRAGG